MRTCPVCGDALSPTQKKATYCSPACRQKAYENRKQAIPTPAAVAQVVAVAADPAGKVRAATLRELEAVDRADTPLGLAALALAERIDLRADTGSSLASAVKQLAVTIEAATKGTAAAASPLDQLRARREAKRAG